MIRPATKRTARAPLAPLPVIDLRLAALADAARAYLVTSVPRTAESDVATMTHQHLVTMLRAAPSLSSTSA